jgi:hypothetical protein
MEPFAWEMRDEAVDNDGVQIPLRRFRKYKSAAVLLDGNKPAHVRGTTTNGVVVAQTGPYPLSGNWWDEQAWARVEWDVQVADGTLLRCQVSEDGWEIDGIYD